MARQKDMKVTGTYDGIIYYRLYENLYCMRTVPAVVRQTEATKASAADLGTKSRSASLIKNGFASLINDNKDARMWSRLVSAEGKAMQADTKNPKGKLCVQNGDPGYLLNFQFNARAETSRILKVKPYVDLSEDGQVIFKPPELIPQKDNRAPKGTDVTVITVQSSFFGFAAFNCRASAIQEIVIPYTNEFFPSGSLRFTSETTSGGMAMLAFSINFYRKHGSFLTMLTDKRFGGATVAGIKKF